MQPSADGASLNPLESLRRLGRSGFRRWLRRRVPPARSIRLGHANIFILPNKQGLGFLLVLALMFIGAVNYETNLGFALVFLLLALFVLTIFHTYRNLSGLHLSAVPGAPVFAGELAEVVVVLNRHGARCHESIRLGFPGARRQFADLIDATESRVPVYVPAPTRGWLRPGRLVVDTVFPFGICRAWSLPALRLHCLVYPRPVECDLERLLGKQAESGSTTLVRGTDDFYSLREYRHGDPLKHVAWKIYARGQGMLVKEYASAVDRHVWLRWEMFAGMTPEQRLSRLCWCVLQLDASGTDYGLELPGTRLQPARGEAHYRRALRALALYGLDETDAGFDAEPGERA